MANRNLTMTLSAVAALGLGAAAYSTGHIGDWLKSGLNAASTDAKAQGDTAGARTAGSTGVLSVELNDKQLTSVKVEPVGEYVFPVEKASVGSIDFNEEMTVQVFTPYQGRIIDTFAKVGDEVKKGQTQPGWQVGL
jgi:membrane fusion protein, heavy metal efflux system